MSKGTSKQLTLFDDDVIETDNKPVEPATIPISHMSRATDPSTSHAAAEQHVKSGKADSNRKKVLAGIEISPGQTSDELADALGMDRHEVARRLPELEHQGMVRKGDKRKSWLTGNECVTWWPTQQIIELPDMPANNDEMEDAA